MITNICFAIIFLLMMFSGCVKEESLTPELQGAWVESSLREDTIIFNSPDFDFGENWFDLRREGMISSGPYEYRIHGDSISVHWMLSSCTCWEIYYFRLDNRKDEFRIGNFYYSEELNSESLIFVKIQHK